MIHVHPTHHRHPLRWLIVVPLTILTAASLLVRFRPPGPVRFVGQFNKRVINRVTLRLAGLRHSPVTLLIHRGRRSGRSYQTPVMAARDGDRFFIGLTYGPGVDWCRNAMAAGRCTLGYEGASYEVTAPAVVDASVALPHFPGPVRVAARLIGLRDFLQVELTD